MKFILLLLTNFFFQNASAQVFIPFSYWQLSDPALLISDGATYNYGSTAINTGVDKIFTVSNTTASGLATNITTAAFATAAYTFKGGSFPGTGGTCLTSIVPATSCTIVVTALSAVGGTFNDTITLNFLNSKNNGTYSAARAITASFTSTPTDLLVTATDFIKANDCAPVTIQSTDYNGNVLNVLANTTVTLSINNAINSAFYTDSACTPAAITTTVIAINTNTNVVYFKSTTSNQSGILVATATGLASGQKNVTITAAPTKLKIIALPQMKTSACSLLSVNTVDSNNFNSNASSNITVNLTTNGANIYYSDSGCVSVITSTIIVSGTYTKAIYTSNATIQTLTATATDNAAVLTAATASINFLTTLTWWDTNWTKRITIAINNTDQASAFTNQPVLVVLTPSNVNYANFNANGSDLRFVASDNTTLLDHEIETWNPSGTSEIWVRIPSIAASVDTGYFFMYFKNIAAADIQNKTGVWSNYWAVWHFNEDPANAAPQYLDSTSGARNGTGSTGANLPTKVIAAPIGYAVGLNTTPDFVQISGDLSVALGGNSTFSAWMRTTGNGTSAITNTPGLTGIGGTLGKANDIYFCWLKTGGYIGLTATTGLDVVSAFTVNNGAWRHVSMSRNSGTGAVKFYINGVLSGSGNSGTGTTTTYFDKFGVIAGSNKEFTGDLDEVRIYNSVQTDAQIEADFKYMMNTHLFYNATEVWP